MTHKDLAERHPLFRRLSGQVIWLFFEERETDPETIDAFLQACENLKARTLDAADQLLASLSDGSPGHIRFVQAGMRNMADPAAYPPPCARCRDLRNRLLPADHPRLWDFFPPFGLGCRLQPEFVPSGAEIDASLVIPPQAEPPARDLICPSEWVFEHPWTSHPARCDQAGLAAKA